MRGLAVSTLTLVLCVYCHGVCQAQDYGPGGHPEKLPPYDWRTAKFRYVIFDNKVVDYGESSTWREVGVLLDREAFSLDTLKELFRLVSRRFPSPPSLHVMVYTSLVDVPTPEESEIPGKSGMADDPHFGEHP
ncbi:MAG: hypothetical protein AB1898_32395 [Acidobacteriota bacterium]